MLGLSLQVSDCSLLPAGPGLAAQLTTELIVLDPESFVGLTMNEVVVRVQERVLGQVLLPLIMAEN